MFKHEIIIVDSQDITDKSLIFSFKIVFHEVFKDLNLLNNTDILIEVNYK